MSGPDDKAGSAMTWVALGIFTLILLLVLIFSEPVMEAFCPNPERHGGRCLRDLVHEFQTLITGFAALFAAGLTVLTMEKTDARQAQRHRQTVNLAIRADALVIDRLMSAGVKTLQTAQRVIGDVSRASAGQRPESIVARLSEIRSQVSFAGQALQHPDWIAARPLFRGELVRKTESLTDVLSKTLRTLRRYGELSARIPEEDFDDETGQMYTIGTPLNSEEEYEVFTGIDHCVETVHRSLPLICQRLEDQLSELERLKAMYEDFDR